MSPEAVRAMVDRIITAGLAASAVGSCTTTTLSFHSGDDDVVRAVGALIGGTVEPQVTDHGDCRTRILKVRTLVGECSVVVFGAPRLVVETVETLEYAS